MVDLTFIEWLRIIGKMLLSIVVRIMPLLRKWYLKRECRHIKINYEIREVKIAHEITRYNPHKIFRGVVVRIKIDNRSDLDLKFDSISVTVYANRYPLYKVEKFGSYEIPDCASPYPKKSIPKRKDGYLDILVLVPPFVYTNEVCIFLEGFALLKITLTRRRVYKS